MQGNFSGKSIQDLSYEFGNKTFVLEGRIVYPELIPGKLNVHKESGRVSYQTMFLWERSQNAQVVQEIMSYLGQGFDTFFTNLNHQALTNPIKDGHTYVRTDGKPVPEYQANAMWFNASTGEAFPPMIAKKDENTGRLSNLTNPELEIYSGRNAAIVISFFPIGLTPRQDGKPTRKGFTTNLHQLLLLDGGEKISSGGGVEVNPQEAFAKFLQGTAPAQNQGQPAQPAQPAQGFGQVAQPAQPAQPAQGFGQVTQPAQPAQGFGQVAQPAPAQNQGFNQMQGQAPAQNQGFNQMQGQAPAQNQGFNQMQGQAPAQNQGQPAQNFGGFGGNNNPFGN